MTQSTRTLFVMRHGPTAWNADHRIQGRTDVPLSAHGRQVVLARRLPARAQGASWFCSPLQRARETGRLMALRALRTEAALTEIAFGQWEGELVHDPALLARRRCQGWDGRAPGGESRREALARVRGWLRQAPTGDVGLVIHGGLIKALYAAVSGWDLCGETPVQLGWEQLHCFALDADGALQPGSWHSEAIGEERSWRFDRAA